MSTKTRSKAQTVADYIAQFPPEVRGILKKIRMIIRKAAPNADESISYGVPAFKMNGPLVYFAAFKSHVSLYPMTEVVKEKFKKELVGYKGGKGTIQFPLDEPIPYALIERLVKFKVKQARERD
jgi:uncharacterized protein YdhG (YjbR/CyaY superfamily)